MIPVYQNLICNKHGDCQPACIASILEIQLDEIPDYHMEDDDFVYYDRMIEFLDGRGYVLLDLHAEENKMKKIGYLPFVVGCHCILSVPSQKFDKTTHAVVGKFIKLDSGEIKPIIVHDPNPNNEKYTEDFKFYSVEFLVKK